MSEIRRILVVQPNWVGDAVMATPALRALRELYPDSHISYLARRYVKALFMGMPWHDQLLTFRTGKSKSKTGKGILKLATRLRAGKFDMAVLLPNSFRMALLCKLAGIKRVVGYERDGRSFLLSDRLLPAKEKGKYIPTPIVGYYMGLVHYLGSRTRNLKMELFVTASEKEEALRLLARAGLEEAPDRPASHGGAPMVFINPGAQYGDAKCWLPEHFAAVADQLIEQRGATVLIGGTPRERRILDAVHSHMRHSAVDLVGKGLTLGSLKEIIRRCDLVITNDTGPRHIAAAFDVPIVTVFGPTHPIWSEINDPLERQVAADVFCGPCQKKRCSLDHRCMTRITPAMVLKAATELLPACG